MFSFAFVLGKGKAQRSMEEQRKQSVCLKGDVGFRCVIYIYSMEYGVIYSYILRAMSSHVASLTQLKCKPYICYLSYLKLSYSY